MQCLPQAATQHRLAVCFISQTETLVTVKLTWFLNNYIFEFKVRYSVYLSSSDYLKLFS